MIHRKKLIEVALPLEAINKAAKEEKSVPRHGHPQTLHYWWARRPLAVARGVIFAQMVDDPSSHPDIFRTEKAQEKERQRLFKIIEDLVQWENTTNEEVLERARAEIWQSWRSACADYADHPRARELFDRRKLPAFHDPFAGGGTLPLEAQRLGLESYASDLNPVAVLINKAMIEIPPKFAGKPPVNAAARSKRDLIAREWRGAQGIAEDVRYYGQWMQDEAERRIGHIYPKVEITTEIAKERPDLDSLLGKHIPVLAWLWVRTVKSPNPAFAQVDVPLASTFVLASRGGKEIYVEPLIDGSRYKFRVRIGTQEDSNAAIGGTKLARGANFRCLLSGTPISGDYIKEQGQAGLMGARLIAIIAQGEQGRVYLPPTEEQESVAQSAKPEWEPDTEISGSTQYIGVKPYGIHQFSQLFTPRQLVALTTFTGLIEEARERVKGDAVVAGFSSDEIGLEDGGHGAQSYSDAISVYLSCALSRLVSYSNTLCFWNMKGGSVAFVFSRQALQMSWDFIEINPLRKMSGNWSGAVDWVCDVVGRLAPAVLGHACQQDATSASPARLTTIVSTDPPYYDNVPYADLSDFFYVWLRPALKASFSDIFGTLASPKAEELVAFAYRHKSKEAAGVFFMNGMTRAMQLLEQHAHPAFPVTIYYAFRQSETTSDAGTASTGWETFLDAVIRAGFVITGTWPVRTERGGGVRNVERNSLASSIILVCTPRASDAGVTTRRDFLSTLKIELPLAVLHLQRGNVAPVDLAQAAIGPGMAVYTRFASVLNADGKPLSVRDALALINQTLDTVLSEQEGDFDADTRWALAWFEQSGFETGEYGVAETLSKAKNTSVAGMVDAGFLSSKGGKVRLLRPDELADDWDPATDSRLTAWEVVHQLIRVLEAGGEGAAAELVGKLSSKAEPARELAYRLYTICERKKRAPQALSYNALVQSWPEITRLAADAAKHIPLPEQTEFKLT